MTDIRNTEFWILREFHRELKEILDSGAADRTARAKALIEKCRKDMLDRFGHERPDADALLAPVVRNVHLERAARRLT